MKNAKIINQEEDKIERELIKRIEDKIKNSANSISTKVIEMKFENESIVDNSSDISNIDKHFNRADLNIKDSSTTLNKKTNLYNEKVGQYNHLSNTSYVTSPRKFDKVSSLSKYLLDKEESLNNILPSNKILDLNYSESFNFRMFKCLDNYSDILLSQSDLQIRQKFMNVYLFHILNHVMKRKEEIEVNDRIEKLIERTSKQKYCEETQIKDDLFINDDEEFLKKYIKESDFKNFAQGREDFFEEFKIKGKFKENHTYTNEDYELIKDQGFTAPRVLILVPNKKHAKLLIDEMLTIMNKSDWKGVTNKKKFKEDFSETESMNDCFRIGLNFDFFNNKLKLYQSFDTSDIIIASPLGLKLTISNDESVKNKKVYDFLSSIEILLIDFAEVFLYQNIDHLEEILQFMNKIPKNNQNIVNINRIKDSVKNNNLEYLRQNIVISHFKNLEIEMLVRKYCKNVLSGIYIINETYENLIDKINSNIKKKISDGTDTLDKTDKTVKYEFKILKTFDDMDIYDNKFNFFTKNLWQSLYDTFDRHTIIFTSSTLDYVRLKAFFKKTSVNVTFISEDTDKKDWQRNRLFFEEGRYKFLLYSERAHFYKKINLKFAKNIFFYSLPEDPSVFTEMIEMIAPQHYKDALEKYKIEDKNLLSNNYSAVIALVSKMEKYTLEKIVGTNTSSYIFKNKLDNYVI